MFRLDVGTLVLRLRLFVERQGEYLWWRRLFTGILRFRVVFGLIRIVNDTLEVYHEWKWLLWLVIVIVSRAYEWWQVIIS